MSSTMLNDVWRACRKIQSAIFRVNIDIRQYFEPDLSEKKGFISEAEFVSRLERLRDPIGLSETEMKEVTDYFRIQDGRIACDQFCNAIWQEGFQHLKNKDMVSGLEWNDPLHSNVLEGFEERRLCLILTKIAKTVLLREIALLPYFQDYELVSKEHGAVTIVHFSRILHFLKIYPSENDFRLLVKKYLKDAYTVDYVAFTKDIEKIVQYLDKNRLVDSSQAISVIFPGKQIDVDLPKLPRPELYSVNEQDIFHPLFSSKSVSTDIVEIVLRIKNHVFENRIRIHEFFEDFDGLRSGVITKNNFRRALDSIGVSRLDRLYLTQGELELLLKEYECPWDNDRVNWRQFESDVNLVFSERGLEKKPFGITLKTFGADDKQLRSGDLCEQACLKINARIRKRRLYLQQFFRDFDKLNHGYVNATQLRQVLFSNGIILPEKEIRALEERYSDDQGFNYMKFLLEVDSETYAVTEPTDGQRDRCLLTIKEPNKMPNLDNSIILTLSKIKRQIVIKRIRVLDFLKDYDKTNRMNITENQFRRGLSNANINVSSCEMHLLCELFKVPFTNDLIDYRRFCDTIEEAFVQKHLEKAPLLIPMQYIPFRNDSDNFLDDDDRQKASAAMLKLSKKWPLISSIESVFKGFDRRGTGRVSKPDFTRTLNAVNVLSLLSSREQELIFKVFSVIIGRHHEFEYRSFVKTIRTLYELNLE